jgi:Ca2+-binding RTX toxin-like protein
MTGGAGDDTYFLDVRGDVVVESAGGGTDTVVTQTSRTLDANVENLTLTGTATAGNGNALDNLLTGNAMDNALNGLGGNDVLFGGLGNDTMYGGSGNDTFVFNTALDGVTNMDVVADLASGDVIALDNDVFTQLGSAGALSGALFFSGAGVMGASVAGQGAGVYYDSTTGNLYYEEDGFGGDAAVQFARLIGVPSVTASTFVVQD